MTPPKASQTRNVISNRFMDVLLRGARLTAPRRRLRLKVNLKARGGFVIFLSGGDGAQVEGGCEGQRVRMGRRVRRADGFEWAGGCEWATGANSARVKVAATAVEE